MEFESACNQLELKRLSIKHNIINLYNEKDNNIFLIIVAVFMVILMVIIIFLFNFFISKVAISLTSESVGSSIELALEESKIR